MKPGSIVETVGNFERIRRIYGLKYPKKGDVLTVSSIEKHSNKSVRKKGIVLLYFEELPGLIGICNKTINGKSNFVELILPDEILELIEQPIFN